MEEGLLIASLELNEIDGVRLSWHSVISLTTARITAVRQQIQVRLGVEMAMALAILV